MSHKIKTLEKLRDIVSEQKSAGKRIVHCHGVFDLLHVGHIKHLQEAKGLGDVLVITVTPDEFVHKGPNRPAFSIALRLEALAALEVVDFVAANKWANAVDTIELIKPDVYCKGPDYVKHEEDISGKISEEEATVVSVGGSITYTAGPTFSSSVLLNQFGNVLSEDQKRFIEQGKSKWAPSEAIEAVTNLSKLRVLVLGESIIDQYVFCEALGKSGKEPVLVLRELETQQYAGGAIAIARHLADFCGSVTLLSMLGENGEFKEFIEDSLPDNVGARFLKKKGAPTIFKKRFIDLVSNSKTLGVYSLEDSPLKIAQQRELQSELDELIKVHDLIIVSDYGHGFISADIAHAISSADIFSSLNAQINAANIGYHTMDNYHGIDCAIINESELRHEFRDRRSDLTELARKLLLSSGADHLVVTQGSSGATLYRADSDQVHSCPAFAGKVVDKVGSGDAMLALLSCCLYAKVNLDLSLLIGSLAAAQTVETIGNSVSVNKVQLLKSLQYMVK